MSPRVVITARLVVLAARLRGVRARLSRQRHQVLSALLVATGLAGALGGGALIGQWALGLVMIAESVGAVWVGLMRDDGQPLPIGAERSLEQILEAERRRP